MEGASNCNIELGGHDVLDKKTKVKFGTSTHRSEGLLDCVHVSIWGPAKTALLGVGFYLADTSSAVIITLLMHRAANDNHTMLSACWGGKVTIK